MDYEKMAELTTAITELSPQELRIMAHDLANLDPALAMKFATTIFVALENRRQEVQTVGGGRDYVYVDEDEDID